MKKAISTNLTSKNIASVLSTLEESPIRLTSLNSSISNDQLLQPLEPGEGSPTGVLAHLINFETRSSEAIILALLKDGPLVHRIHPERELGKLLHLDEQPFTDLMTYFNFRRTVLLRILESLSENQWSRSIRQDDKQRNESVYRLARSTALHELEHLQDMEIKLG